MKYGKRIVAAAMAALMTVTVLPVSAYASEEANTPKEEVVYINLNADGSVKEVNVVNIFELDEVGTIVDYGNYENLRNMTTTDTINYADGKVTIEADAGKLYYEGKLDNVKIPWNIDIHYYLDGKEYVAKELAGKSGSLRITMGITENIACNGTFFENYALQATLTLDTKKCNNIKADGATIANVGADKQLTYTILPGEGANVEVTAEVTEFEMAAIAINGIPLSLDVEVDDEELMDQVEELLDAIAELDDGAGELKDGAKELKDGAEGDLQNGVTELDDGAAELHDGAGTLKDGGKELNSGAEELKTGISTLNSGVKELNSGISQIQEGLNALNAKSSELTGGSSEVKNALETIQEELTAVSVSADQLDSLVQGSAGIKEGIDELSKGIAVLKQAVSFETYKSTMKENGLDIEQLKAGNDAAITSLSGTVAVLETQAEELEAVIQDLPEGTEQDTIDGYQQQLGQMKAQIDEFEKIIALLNGSNANIAGIEAYLGKLGTEMDKLVSGVNDLKENYDVLDTGINSLVTELKSLLTKMAELKTGIDTLVTEYDKLDTGINEYTAGVAEIVAGYSEVSKGSKSLVSGSKDLVEGSSSLYDGTSDLLSGIVEIYDGTGTLKDGTGELNDGVLELLAGIIELYDGTGEMKDGTSEFREETNGMDTEISDKIDEMLESFTGDIEITSFVSEKNTNIDAVQFVIQTENIEIEEAEDVTVEVEEPLSFWEKFLALFGI